MPHRVRDTGSPRAPHRGLELLAELGEFIGAEIADRPVVQPALAPAPDVKALDGFGFGGAMPGAGRWRDEKIDDVAAPPVPHCAERACIDAVEPAADQRKALRSQIDHRGSHVQLAVEPRFYGV